MARTLQILVTLCLLTAAGFLGWQRMSATATGAERGEAEQVFERELGLTATQTAVISEVLAGKQSELKQVLASFEPRMDASREAAKRELSAILTPHQQQLFTDSLDEMRKRHSAAPTMLAVLLPHCKHAKYRNPQSEVHAQATTATSETASQRSGRIDRLMARLELEPQQTERVREILSRLYDEIKPIKIEAKQAIRTLQEEVAAAVAGDLNTAQRTKWKALIDDPSPLCLTRRDAK